MVEDTSFHRQLIWQSLAFSYSELCYCESLGLCSFGMNESEICFLQNRLERVMTKHKETRRYTRKAAGTLSTHSQSACLQKLNSILQDTAEVVLQSQR